MVQNSVQAKGIYPRTLAVRILTRVLSHHQALDEAIQEASRDLPPESMGWIVEVCSGTLRWKGRLDWVLDSVSLRKKPSGWLRKILLVAGYQLIVQDRVNVGSVVFETVDEIKVKEGEAPARFANACLRKIASHAPQWRTLTIEALPDLKQSAALASLPEWLWKRLLSQYGADWVKDYAQASLSRPTLWLRSRDEEWSADWVKAGPVPCSWEAIQGGAIVGRPGFQQGEFIAQDISSQFLISEVSRRVQKDLGKKAVTVLDLCAAPGGKSVGLAWNGLQVTATDHSSQRASLLKESVKRAAPTIEVIPWSDVEKTEAKELVWVDAPCSGTGILRRHPDVRWLRKEEEIAGLKKTQLELLKKGWSKVSSEGFLVYSVCSVLKDEGEEILKEAGLTQSVIERWSLGPQVFPYGDGFWAALLKR